MTYNPQHDQTFKSLLEVHGLSEEMAKDIAGHLACIDNNQQDELIQKWVCDYVNKQMERLPAGDR